jgi:hypothetical protein
MRTGILSDDYIMKNVCVEYRPVPLGKVGDILTPEMKPKHGLELRAAKYVRPPVRPATFQAMSNSLSNQADPTNPLPVQQQLAKQYEQEVDVSPVETPMNLPVEPSNEQDEAPEEPAPIGTIPDDLYPSPDPYQAQREFLERQLEREDNNPADTPPQPAGPTRSPFDQPREIGTYLGMSALGIRQTNERSPFDQPRKYGYKIGMPVAVAIGKGMYKGASAALNKLKDKLSYKGDIDQYDTFASSDIEAGTQPPPRNTYATRGVGGHAELMREANAFINR